MEAVSFYETFFNSLQSYIESLQNKLHGNEDSGSIKDGEFIDQLCDCQLLKNFAQ